MQREITNALQNIRGVLRDVYGKWYNGNVDAPAALASRSECSASWSLLYQSRYAQPVYRARAMGALSIELYPNWHARLALR